MTKQDLKTLGILAYKNKPIMATIKSVSASGMTRKISFYAMGKGYKRAMCLNSEISLIAGYKLDKNGYLIVYGCGMDMVFSVLSQFNYAISTIIDGKQTKNYSKYFFDADNYQLI